MARSLLLICRHSPWSGLAAREVLDIALAGGAFDLPIAMLFIDDGVFQLQDAQAPKQLEQKDLTAQLKALSLFGVEQLYVDAHSLKQRGLSISALALPAAEVQHDQLSPLLNQFDHVVTL